MHCTGDVLVALEFLLLQDGLMIINPTRLVFLMQAEQTLLLACPR